jgi:hypothetical protein
MVSHAHSHQSILVPCQTDGEVSPVVMPAEAGIQKLGGWTLDSRWRGNDVVTVCHQLHIDELLAPDPILA